MDMLNTFSLLFGCTISTFVYGLMVQFYQREMAWINYKILYGVSTILFIITIYTGWPLLKIAFS